MLEPFEHRGLWWLPERSEERVAGVLTFSQEEARLELIGLLPRPQPEPEPEPEPEPDERGVVELPLGGALSRQRILGLSVDGKAFTLEDCQATEFKLSAPGLPTEAFVPGLILRGAHYEAEEEVVFDELLVAYTQLDAWVATSGFNRA